MAINSTALILQPVTPEIPDNIQGDRQLLAEMAPAIRNLWAQIDNAQVYIEAGRKFKPIHGRLVKNSRHDRKRIGWYQAFQEERFGCSRQEAEACVKIYNAFGDVADAFATSRLPQSLGALHMLARLELSPTALAQRLRSEEINPKTSVRAIRKLGESIGRLDPNPTKKVKAPTLNKQSWNRASLEEQRKFIDDIGVDVILGACSQKATTAWQNRCAGNCARKSANGPQLFPALKSEPAKVVAMPRHDLISTWCDRGARKARARAGKPDRRRRVTDISGPPPALSASCSTARRVCLRSKSLKSKPMALSPFNPRCDRDWRPQNYQL